MDIDIYALNNKNEKVFVRVTNEDYLKITLSLHYKI